MRDPGTKLEWPLRYKGRHARSTLRRDLVEMAINLAIGYLIIRWMTRA